MNYKGHFETALQAFCAGAIFMGYVSGYNTKQLPIAILCLCMSLAFRFSR